MFYCQLLDFETEIIMLVKNIPNQKMQIIKMDISLNVLFEDVLRVFIVKFHETF